MIPGVVAGVLALAAVGCAGSDDASTDSSTRPDTAVSATDTTQTDTTTQSGAAAPSDTADTSSPTDPSMTTSAQPEDTTTTTTSPDDAAPPLQRDDEGEPVTSLQTALNEWLEGTGSDTFPIATDGIFGPQTEAAIIEFQDATDDLASDGVVDPEDRVALDEAVDAPEPGGGSAVAAIEVGGGRDSSNTVFGIEPNVGGIDVDAEIAGINDVLGTPTGDSGWLPMPIDELPCKRDTEHRQVVWNDLRLSFERGFEGADLGGWNLGPAEILAPQSPTPLEGSSGVTTLEGVTIGSPASALDAYESALDNDELVIVDSGVFPVGFDLVDDRVVSISSGPLDCIDPGDPAL